MGQERPGPLQNTPAFALLFGPADEYHQTVHDAISQLQP
jgi:hypothetical protein